MTVRLRVALAGCGRMGCFTTERTRDLLPACWMPLSHAEAATSDPRLTLVAVADTDFDRAAAAGARYGIEPALCYRDAEKMIADCRPDILAVATRSPGRASILETAMRCGVRGIHAEKPLTQRLGDTVSLMQAVKEAGIAFTYGTVRRFMAPYRLARDLMRDGAIGEIREIAIDHGYREALLWSHPHTIDLLLFFGGSDIVEVQAKCDFGDMPRSDSFVDGDPALQFARLEFSSGVQGLIGGGGSMSVRISGTDGVLRVVGDGSRVEIHRSRGAGDPYFTRVEEVPIPESRSGTAQAFAELADAILGGPAPGMSPEEVVSNQRVIGAIVLSSLRGGAPVAPGEIAEEFTITGRSGNLYA